MELSDLIVDALGLKHASIESFQVDKPKLKLEIWLKQKRECCVCAKCHGPLLNVKDYRQRTLRGPPFGAYREVIIHIKRLRAVCGTCSGAPELALFPGVHPSFSNLTLALCEVAGQLMEELTCEATARYFRLNSKSTWALDQWRMRRMQKDLKLPNNLDFSHMSADEVHY